jgi:hypothetical protein
MQDNLYGVYRAVVVSTKDPANKRRVRVKAPQVSGNAELQWAEPVNSGSPIPSVNSIIWVMFNGGYINKPVYLPSEDDLVWHTITPITGYTHDGNNEGTVQYTSYVFRGTRYVEWRGGLDIDATGTEGSFAVPNGGTFFTMTDTDLIPNDRRTVVCGKNLYTSANYVNNTAKVDFNTSGNCTLVLGVNFQTNWVSLNGVRYIV